MILIINNGYPSKKYPNYTNYIKTICDCVIKSDNEVDLLVIKYNRKITIFYKLLKYLIFYFKLFFKNLNKYEFIYINHPTFCFPVFFNITFNSSKTFLHWHGNDLVNDNLFFRIIKILILQKIDKSINIVPSLYFKNELIKRLSLKNLNILISPSGGVDTSIFINKKESNDLNDSLSLGFAASLEKLKGFDLFYELIIQNLKISKLTNKTIDFKLINYGKEKDYYINKLSNIRDIIRIYPKMEKSKMPDFFNSIDILIFPSLRDGESLGLIALEAMSCGVPVIAFNNYAFPEFIKSGISGELINNNSDYKNNIEKIINKIVIVSNNLNKYNPESIVNSKYSQISVIEFYKNLFKKRI